MTLRQTGLGWDFLTGISEPPWHLLTLLTPTFFGDPRSAYWPGEAYLWHERLSYLGLVPLLASFFLIGRWRWICWATVAASLALAFGRHVPWYAWAVSVLPGYASFRTPAKHLVLASLAICLAASLGVERLRGRRGLFGALVCAAALDILAAAFLASLPELASTQGGAFRIEAPDAHSAALSAALPGVLLANAFLLAAGLAALLPGVWAPRVLVALAVLDLVVVLAPFRNSPSSPTEYVSRAGAMRAHDRAV
ncbi:MAG: hypothetical protein U0821_26140 [Chloroflexota bacterium]